MKILNISSDKKLYTDDAPLPELKPGYVLIKVAAASVNRADVMQVDGTYPPPPDWPAWPGLEVSGEIAGTCGNSKWHAGDKVCALLGGGGYAEYCAVPEGMVLPVPKNISMIEAASIPEVFSTVYLNFVHEAKIKAGDTVFIFAAASGLGLAAVQFAKHYGCRVISSAGSDDKVEFVRSLGADIAFNRKSTDAQSVFDQNPPDIVLDCTGGQQMGNLFQKMAPWGRWIQVASLAGQMTQISLETVFRKRLRLIGSTLRSRTDEMKSMILAELQQNLWKSFEEGEMRSVIYRTFPFEQANEAHAVLRRNENIGKVVLTLAQ